MATSVRKSTGLTDIGALNDNIPVVVGDLSTGDYLKTTIGALKSYIGITGPVPLTTPTNFTATGVSATQINLAWSDVANESNYQVDVSTNGGSIWTSLAAYAANATSASQTGLTAGATRHYRIKAVGNGTTTGDSPYAYSNATTQISTKLATPSLLFANDGPDGAGFQVQWTKDSRSNQINLRRALDAAFTSGVSVVNGLTNSGNINLGNLTPSTLYYVEVTQIDSTGTYTASDPGTGSHSTTAGFNRTFTFVSSTNNNSDGVNVDVGATSSTTKFQFNAITNILGQSVNMEIYVGNSLVAVVAFYSDYTGQLFKFTYNGTGYITTFTSGTPINF